MDGKVNFSPGLINEFYQSETAAVEEAHITVNVIDVQLFLHSLSTVFWLTYRKHCRPS